MHVKMVTITPQLADKFLKANTRNRKISSKRLKEYKEELSSGHWITEAPSSIAFYKSGELADGQHTLMAIKETGVSVKMPVFYGVSEKAGAVIDKHRPRSDVDAIRIGGLSDWIGQREVSLVRMIANLHSRSAPTYSAHHIADLGNFLQEHIKFVQKVFPTHRKHITTSPVLAAVAIAYQDVDSERLEQFARVLTSGIPEGLDDIAAIRLREHLLMSHGRSGYSARMEMALKAMRAIKAFESGEPLQRLHTPEDLLYRVEGIDEYL